MQINTNGLNKYFSLDGNVKRLENAPVLKSPVMDLIYPESKRELYASAIVKKSDLPSVIKNTPVIFRGDSAYELPGVVTSIDGYEPFPIELSKRILASELNDLVSNGIKDSSIMGDTTKINSVYDNQYERLRKSARATTEALCCQSLRGFIQYPVKNSGDLYKVNFGLPKTVNASKKLDANDISLGDVVDLCFELVDSVSVHGYGQEVALLCGKKAFKAIVKIISNAQNNNLGITVLDGQIKFPAFSLVRIGSSYYDYTAKKDIDSVDANKICAVALDAPFWLPYCAIDDIEADLKALPFFATYQVNKNPSSVDVFGKSKPFPVPVVECIAWTDDLFSE